MLVCVFLRMKARGKEREWHRVRGSEEKRREERCQINWCVSAPCGRQRGKWGDRRSIYPSVCLYVSFDWLSYLRSKLRNSPGGGADATASTFVCVYVCVCPSACPQYKWRLLTKFLIGIREANMFHFDLDITAGQWKSRLFTFIDSNTVTFRFLCQERGNNGGELLLHIPNWMNVGWERMTDIKKDIRELVVQTDGWGYVVTQDRWKAGLMDKS